MTQESLLHMIDSTNRLRVLLIGAGRRIQNNYLPALSCIQETFEIAGIHSRTFDKLEAVAKRWSIPAFRSLSEIDYSKIDVVAVSVPTSQNAIVLTTLLPHAERLRLVIDTPVAWTRAEYDAILPLANKFRTVTITEDYMNFPSFRLIREAVRIGLIGELRNVTLYNIGYLYHGLALLRSFVGFGRVLNTWRKPLNAASMVTGYELEHGVSATIVGPYRRHTTGGIYLDGTKGVITEFPIDRDFAMAGKPTYILSRVLEAGQLSKIEIKSEGQVFSANLDALRDMRKMDFADKSDINLERGLGLIDVFMSLIDFRNINASYTIRDAFYDSFVSRRAQDGILPLDPFNLLTDRRTVTRIRSQAAVALEPTYLKAKPVNSTSLSDSEKIRVAEGTEVEWDTSELIDGHILVKNLSMDGKELPGNYWFLYAKHWVRNNLHQ